MREHKYKAWDIEKKRFWTQEEMTEIGGYYYTYGVTSQEGRFELVEFTGLKDKTGKEIYEGDIVTYSTAWKRMMEEAGSKHSGKKGKEIIVWNEFGFMTQQPEFFDTNVGGRYLWLLKNDKDLEVIGNIYSNKDLL